MNHAQLATKLNSIGQGHVYTFYDRLPPEQQQRLDAQLDSLDLDLVARLIDTVVQEPAPFQLPPDVKPAPYYPYEPRNPAEKDKYQKAFRRGEELLRAGQVAAFVVAGGQGTRLGWDGPKGTFPATPVKRKPLFQCFAEFLLALEKRYGPQPTFYIMTSPPNDAATRKFWRDHQYFGMKPENVIIFPQDVLPAVGFDGKILLETPGSLAPSPNGHGGSLLALYKSGATADMARRGITQISYFQVDNPIVRCIDPLFIGLHDLDGAQMSSKMLPKEYGKEKLGNFCLSRGKIHVIEYSGFPDALAEERLPDGQLRFRAGSIALHALRRDFVEALNHHGFALPYNRADKKVPCADLSTGQPIKPEKPNAVKMESFVFDALPLTDISIIYETNRQDEFAPIKQPTGNDSVESSHAITTLRNAAWLEQAGVHVARTTQGKPDCVIEIASGVALYPDDLLPRKESLRPIKAKEEVYLG